MRTVRHWLGLFIAARTLALLLLAGCVGPAGAVELVTLSPANYDAFRPRGKEASAIFGDYVLRNERIVLAVGNPDLISGRSAGRWGMASVKGAVIDLTRRDEPGDLLTAYHPGPLMHRPDAPPSQADFPDESLTWEKPDREPRQGTRVTLVLPSYLQAGGHTLADLKALPPARQPPPAVTVEVSYTLEDGWDYVQIETIYRNPTPVPQQLNLRALLRADGEFASGLAAEGRLFWVANPWWGQAYGVLAQDHHLQPTATAREHVLDMGGKADRTITLAAGGEFRVNRCLIPGRDLLQVRSVANEILGMTQHTVSLVVTDDAGPVAGADVQILDPEGVYGTGRTGADGMIDFSLPSGGYTLRVGTLGRPENNLALDVNGPVERTLRLERPSAVTVAITDEAGTPIPCKVEFRGIEGTPDPFFFPSSGEHRVQNLGYTRTGTFRQELPPGVYEVIVTHGPEYDADRRRIELAAGMEVRIDTPLARGVDTTGWISADLHNHSAASAKTDLFYVYPYSWNPSVDGDSSASPLGRVLNLLAEQVEFAVPAEHNTVFSYKPLLDRLAATRLMGTADGIGLTAGRRHTVTHQNVFPVVYSPGRQDGGMPQRPEHIEQVNWLQQIAGEAEQLVQIVVPRGQTLAPQRGMDVLDVRDLLPLLTSTPDPNDESRILEWLEILNQGYRLPGVIGSGTFDNFHGAGGVRTYFRVAVDDPAVIDPLEIVRAAKRGRSIMTTGPFLEVDIRPANAPDGKAADPGDELVAPGGAATVHVRVQCANWIDIDRVLVLVNGVRTPELTFTRTTHPELFVDGVVRFEHAIPLHLSVDAHVIVAVGGEGPNLRARRDPADVTMPHAAVSNPIYVDVDGNGFAPHSPFDDSSTCSLEFVRPILACPDAAPGIVRVTIRNGGTQPAEDTVTLATVQPGWSWLRQDGSPLPPMIEILGPAARAYRVAPGGSITLEYELALTEAWLARGLTAWSYSYVAQNAMVRTQRSAHGQGRRGGSTRVVVDHAASQFPPVADLDALADMLQHEALYRVRMHRDGRVLGDLRFALAGEALAVQARVNDARPSRHENLLFGSCVEVFGAMPGQRPIGQIFLVPGVATEPAAAYRQERGHVVPAPEIQVQTRTTADGYEMSALIPLRLLPIDVMRDTILLEFRVTAGGRDDNLVRGTVFQSGAPDRDNRQFGSIRLEDVVRTEIELLDPPSVSAGAAPARLRLRLTNRGPREAADTIVLCVRPQGVPVRIVPPDLAYRLQPGASMTAEFSVTPAAALDVAGLEFFVPVSPRFEIVRSATLQAVVLGGNERWLAPVTTLAEARAAVADVRPYLVPDNVRTLAELRFAVAGDRLLLTARVHDTQITQGPVPWKGSAIEVFGSMPGASSVSQIFLVPATAGRPAQALRQQEGAPVPLPGVDVRSEALDGGYELVATIPLAAMNLDTTQDRLLLEFSVNAARATDARGRPVLARGTLFGSRLAYLRNDEYGLFVLRR